MPACLPFYFHIYKLDLYISDCQRCACTLNANLVTLQWADSWGWNPGMLIQCLGGAAIIAVDAWERLCSRPETTWFMYYRVFVECFCFHSSWNKNTMSYNVYCVGKSEHRFLWRPLFLLLAWAMTSMPSFALALHPAMVSQSWLARWTEAFLALGWEIWPRSWPWLPRIALWPSTWMRFAVQELLASCQPWERSQLELPWAQLLVPPTRRHWPPPRFWERIVTGYFELCSQPRNGDVLYCNKFIQWGGNILVS